MGSTRRLPWLKQLLGILLALLLALGLRVAPVQASIQPDYAGVIPDWQQIAFEALPPVLVGGSIDGSDYIDLLGYDLSRVWEAGDLPVEILKLGDLSEALGAEAFSLEAIARISGIDMSDLPLSAFGLFGEQTLGSLAEAVPDILSERVKDIPVVAELLEGQGLEDIESLAIEQVIARFEEIAFEVPFKEIDLSRFAIGSIEGLQEVALESFAEWGNSFVSEIPGLGAVPLGQFPNPLAIPLGGVALRIDAVYGPYERSRAKTISGSDQQGFSVRCQEGCAYVELDDLENSGRKFRVQEGYQWVSGKYQEVEGGFGVLGEVNGGMEPTGRHPYGKLFKQVVMEPDETSDTVTTALYFRFCHRGPFVDLGCTPYFIGPVPFLTYNRDSFIFVGVLEDIGEDSGVSEPTGAKRGDPDPVAELPEEVAAAFECYVSDLETGGAKKVGIPALSGEVDIKALGDAIAGVESQGSGGYKAVGVHVCADGGRNCGRGLGRYQFMSYHPDAVAEIVKVPGGQEFLNRVNQGYKPSQAELMQYFPPEAQDRALANSTAELVEIAKGQTDPLTGEAFAGARLVERVAQMHFGGPGAPIDGSGSDSLGRLSISDYGQVIVDSYVGGGSSLQVCSSLKAQLPVGGELEAAEELNERIALAVNEMGSFSTVTGPDGGNLACAWAVNRVLENSGIEPLGSNPNYVPSVEADLKAGRGERVTQAAAKAGDVVIAPGQQHIGICLNDGCTRVRSNSSSRAAFVWDSDVNFNGYYGAGSSRIYRVVN